MINMFPMLDNWNISISPCIVASSAAGSWEAALERNHITRCWRSGSEQYGHW